ncbi:peptidoglycan editing factor PgeF [Staphylococcus simulans]|uniref:peptidoglycan editing factor PgeF n=1 Tax=Staphylococcus simulans TaxID=1286 RepID=UPI001E5365B5|nr:peptidoglycan editing factor PgeF [Staphylococcus simulans]MCD8914555.1 peptidoglycan editing factor PgeF [Staphylococcus simulans]
MPEKFTKQPHYLEHTDAKSDQITLGFTTREDGQSPYPSNAFNMALYIDDKAENVHAHQQTLAQAIGYDKKQWVFPIQTHGNHVVEVTTKDANTNIDTLTDALHGVDGLYTYDSNLLLTMCYADCVPVYFYSTKHHFIGLAHAGWKGTVGRISEEILKQIDFDLADLKVVIGPATSNSYEINDDIKAQFEALPVDASAFIETRGSDRHGIDLKEANRRLLIQAGVPEANIDVTEYATSENLDLFFSYRVEKSKTGRMLAFIGQ